MANISNLFLSVIIPAYNKAELTAQTVESVLSQTYPNIEIIVVDDGAADSTRQRLAGFTDRIQYIYKENGGACDSYRVDVSKKDDVETFIQAVLKKHKKINILKFFLIMHLYKFSFFS